MKNKYILLLFLSFMIALFTYGQSPPQLTFRFANPRTIRYGSDYFEFDIQVMANTAGTYIWSGQAVLTFNNTTLSTSLTSWFLTPGPLLSGYNSRLPHNHYYKYTLTNAMNNTPPNMTTIIAWTGDPVVEGHGPNSNDFNLMPTSYQTLVTVDAPITSPTGVADISFIQASMNGYQFYISAPSTFTAYYYPNLYDPHNFVGTFVGRIYSNTYGWSQVGNSVDGQWVDWTTAVNTSVWDTVGGAAAQIASSVTNGQAGALRIDTTAALNINAGAALTCSGATEINGSRGLIISASSSGMGQFIDNGTIIYNNNASAQVQCYLVYDEWHYYTIPVTSTQAYPYLNKYMMYYQEPYNYWKYVRGADTILNTSMLGYGLWACSSGVHQTSNYVEPSGILNTGAKSIGITNTYGYGEGWNLIGNPYPSAIDLTSSSVTWGTAYPTAYFWNPSEGNYDPYPTTNPYPITHSKYAPPQQAFFVYCPSNTTFGVNNSARLINSTTFLKDAIPDILILTATSSGNNYSDESIIRFTQAASSYFDPCYDAFKLYGDQDAPQLYSIGNGDTILCINALNSTGVTKVVPMGFSCGLNGSYTILASNMETFQSSVSIYIEDLKTDTWQDLRANPSYRFSYSTTDNPNRFIIHFTGPFTIGDDNSHLPDMQIYSFENYVYVKNLEKVPTKGNIEIYDLLGRKVFQARLKDMEINKFMPGVNEGYYLVNVITDNNFYTRKVYLK
jgi:hypothetical protein